MYKRQLLGCVNIVKDEQTNEFKFKGAVDLALTNVNLKNWYNELESRNYTHDEKIAMFKELPVGIQLAMVKNTLTDGRYVAVNGQYVTKGNLRLNPNHILSLLSPNTMESTIVRLSLIHI